jgi:hypothetical protein
MGTAYVAFLFSLRRRPKRAPGLVAAQAVVLSFPPMFAIFALWGLVEALDRLMIYGFVFSVPILAYLWTHSASRTAVRGVTAISVTIIVLSCILFVTTPTFGTNTISPQEESAGLWIVGHTSRDTVVFTDYRLASMLTSNGWFSAVGLFSADPANKTLTALDSIFYGNSAEAALSSLAGYTSFNGNRPRFLFLSDQMSDGSIGISTSGLTLKAAPPEFAAKFNRDANFALVFDSGQAKVYLIEAQGW